MPPALAIHALAKRYHVGVPGCSATVQVLRGVDLIVGRGELVEVAGSPASGKSTLLLCAAGLLRPDRGRIAWCGVSSVGDPPVAAYAAVESFRRTPATVREQVGEWARGTRPAGRDYHRAVDAALDRAVRHELALSPLAELGRGARWRLLVARALLAGPRLLLLDEPFAGLVAGERTALARCLGRVVGSGIAVLLASTPGDAGVTGARGVTLSDGRLQLPPSDRGEDVHAAPGDGRRVRVAEGDGVSSA